MYPDKIALHVVLVCPPFLMELVTVLLEVLLSKLYLPFLTNLLSESAVKTKHSKKFQGGKTQILGNHT